MNSHKLAEMLLEMPDVPVKLFTDHGQTISSFHTAKLSRYSENDEVCFEKGSDEWEEEDYSDLVDVIEIYGE